MVLLQSAGAGVFFKTLLNDQTPYFCQIELVEGCEGSWRTQQDSAEKLKRTQQLSSNLSSNLRNLKVALQILVIRSVACWPRLAKSSSKGANCGLSHWRRCGRGNMGWCDEMQWVQSVCNLREALKTTMTNDDQLWHVTSRDQLWHTNVIYFWSEHVWGPVFLITINSITDYIWYHMII